MTFKDILVHIDNSPQCAKRVEVALNLSKAHSAHLTALYVVVHKAYATQPAGLADDLEQAEARFLKEAGEAGVDAGWITADWGTVGVGMEEVINFHAHTRDLVIVGQTDPKEQQWDVPSDLPQQVVAGAGRPVLVVPYAGSFPSVGTRPIVAWKNGRAAARAVSDSFPFLLNAEEVFVLSIVDPRDSKQETQEDSICANLQRHGIRVKEDHFTVKNIPVASLLINFAWEKSCDLVIIGTHVKRSRNKMDLGPVATDFLNYMTLPVLMIH